MICHEVNFDGLVGPTHNYAGLSFGNVASEQHAKIISSPKQAALQGLEKMMFMARLGLKQGVIPPHERPHIPTLKRLGISGTTDSEILSNAANTNPELLAAMSSASSMWVANAATISPFADAEDAKTHITPANLSCMFHRSIEADITARMLSAIFSTEEFIHHPCLPAGYAYSDEGAANHTRFCQDYAKPGVEFFVYGDSSVMQTPKPRKFPARQTLESCQAISRNHCLNPDKTVFAQQHPDAIDMGVFHNDVIAVGNKNLLFYHEKAFLDTQSVKRQLNTAYGGDGLVYIEVLETEVTLADAVASYLFNSQLVSVPGQEGMCLIAPSECAEIANVKEYLDDLVSGCSTISQVSYLDLKQSMRNGGGPACLRLRVVMNESQIKNTSARVFLDEELYEELKDWVNRHYRESLTMVDLSDPTLLKESREALDQLTQILRIGSIYEFQESL